jgi:mannobiose 2-epimerase
LYELTGAEIHRRKLLEVIDVLWARMFHAPSWTGIAQFTLDFTPLPAIMFRTVWGSDRDNEGEPRPLDNTSYGHNIEFLWLLRLELAAAAGRSTPGRGIRRGAPHRARAGPQKEFWQQAESLVGLLDAYLLFGDRAYWDAFRSTWDFVRKHLIHPELGEWHALADRDGTILWDYLGHAWKNNYHTTRSMVQVLQRLARSRRGSGAITAAEARWPARRTVPAAPDAGSRLDDVPVGGGGDPRCP